MKNFLGKSKKIFREEAGFTLLEVLMVSSIMVLVLGTGFSILFTGQRLFARASDLMDIQFEARKVMNRLSSELRNTAVGQIYILDATGGHVLSDSRLRFQLPVDYDDDGDVLDSWGHIEWGETSSKQLDWSREYVLSGTDLLRRVYNGLSSQAVAQPTYEIVLGKNVSSLNFTGMSFTGSAGNLNLVDITLTIQRLNSPLQVTLRNKVKFRN